MNTPICRARRSSSMEARPPMLANSRLLSSLPTAAKAAACTLLLIAPEARAQLMPSDAPLQYSATLLAQGNPRVGAVDLRLQYRHLLGGAGSGSAIGGFPAVAAASAGLPPRGGLL